MIDDYLPARLGCIRSELRYRHPQAIDQSISASRRNKSSRRNAAGHVLPIYSYWLGLKTALSAYLSSAGGDQRRSHNFGRKAREICVCERERSLDSGSGHPFYIPLLCRFSIIHRSTYLSSYIAGILLQHEIVSAVIFDLQPALHCAGGCQVHGATSWLHD